MHVKGGMPDGKVCRRYAVGVPSVLWRNLPKCPRAWDGNEEPLQEYQEAP